MALDVPRPVRGWSLTTTDAATLARQFFAAVVPRPIALVTTRSPDGTVNVAPYAFFGAVSHDPPMVTISPDLRDGELKDTAANIRDTGEFVICLVTEEMVPKALVSARPVSRGTSEAALAGFELEPSMTLSTPRVAGTPVALECRLWDTVWLPSGRPLLIGQVEHLCASEAICDDRGIRADRVRAVGRLGADLFCRTGDVFAGEFPQRL